MELTCKNCQVRTRRVPRQRPPRAAHALGVSALFPHRVITRGTSADSEQSPAALPSGEHARCTPTPPPPATGTQAQRGPCARGPARGG